MEQKEQPLGFRQILLLMGAGIVLFLCLSDLGQIWSGFLKAIGMLSPLWIGIFFCYALNLPMRALEKWLTRFFPGKKEKEHKRRRAIAIALTLVIILAALVLLVCFFIPQLAQSLERLGENLPSILKALNDFFLAAMERYRISPDVVERFAGTWNELLEQGGTFIKQSAPILLNVTGRVANGLVDGVMGFILAVYLLYDKERYMRLLRKLVCAFFSEKRAKRILTISGLMHRTFTGFLTGQLTEALILGGLCFLGMVIFRMPYALLVSLLITVTGVIPVLGAYLGTIPAALLILTISPVQALWFLVFIVVLQQVENNLIYPRVVGNSIGLGGFWVILAIVIGGSIGGIPGVFLGVPIMAVLYTLGHRFLNNLLKARNIVIK